ncbi:MAG: hypothetical protein WB682_00880 [Candidatus Dormiibacterota bacterium]
MVELLDLPLQLFGGDVGLFAASRTPAVFLAETEEVEVAALRTLKRKTPAADCAVEEAFEVVRVADLAGPAAGTAGEQVLDLEEGPGVHQGLVEPLVLDSLPLHQSGIELVGQQPGQAVHGDGHRRVVLAPAVGQTSTSQLFQQRLKGVVPGRVKVESELDQVCPLGIRSHVGDAPAARPLAHVDVAERSAVSPAAHLDFLLHAFLDFGREVGRVELRHQGVDAFNQPS